MAVITLKLDDKQIKLLTKLYEEYQDPNIKSIYVQYLYRMQDCVISVYKSGKTVFQGQQADYYASVFTSKDSVSEHAGSDEVGTGDYYGPVCVCACIVHKKDEALLNKLAIRDSKALMDQQILEIAPKLMKTLDYSLLILDNKKYNQIYGHNNLNVIKAKMHNQAYINLTKKYQLPTKIIIDQFTPEVNYYRYLKDEPQIIDGITFETKAEDKYLAVACASMIARYGFLQVLKNMEDHYEWIFLKGAGKAVDENAKAFVNKFGKDKLKLVAKLNFKNTTRVLDEV